MLINHTGCPSVRFGLLVAFVAVLVVPGATEDPPAPKVAAKVSLRGSSIYRCWSPRTTESVTTGSPISLWP